MSDLKTLVRDYSIKHECKIKKICEPLQGCLNIPLFGYFTIDHSGGFCNISTHPPDIEFYYEEKIYLSTSYLKHPSLLQSGYTMIQISSDPLTLKKMHQNRHLNYIFLKIQQTKDGIEGFIFADKNQELKDCSRFLNQIHLLNKFACYFKREAKVINRQSDIRKL